MIRKITNLAVLCLAAIICYGMQISKPHYVDLTGPIPAHGGMSDRVETRLFDLNVDKVEFAKELSVNEFGNQKTLTTSGLWAIVTIDLAAKQSTTTVAAAAWQGPTGLRFRQTERLPSVDDLPPHTIEPGLPLRGRFVFEVPLEEIANASLIVSNARFFVLDSEARIALDGVRLGTNGTPETVIPIYDMDKPI